ncbi:MAG: hypothetical protein K0Q68_1679 [Moraxellaceae bacterium]|jgi:uncharacterized protein (DUF2062 family)|nr:hypothetical protein [Moraxellaceae bacterium]
MPKRLITRYLPAPERIIHHPMLRFMSKRLAEPGLWHLHRRSAAGAMFWGLWCAMLPMPFQMLPAAALAILFRVNLPLTMLLVWISNPLTLLPLMWVAYWLGSTLLGLPMASGAELGQFLNELTRVLGNWMGYGQPVTTHLARYLEPFLLGTMVLGLLAGSLGYVLMRLYWRWHVLNAWKRRQRKRQQATPVA